MNLIIEDYHLNFRNIYKYKYLLGSMDEETGIEEITGIEELVMFCKGHKRLTGVLAGGLVALTIAVGSYVYSRYKSASDFFEQNPPQGVIAYSSGNTVKWFDAEDISDLENAKVLQAKSNVGDLLWLNENEIIYVSGGEGKHNSHHLYKANVVNGEVSVIFDPYNDSLKGFFGDVEKKEEKARKKQKERLEEFEEDMDNREDVGSNGIEVHLFYSCVREVSIEELGLDKGSKEIFMKIGDIWYGMDSKGGNFQRPNILPEDITTTQLSGPDGHYEIVKQPFFYRLVRKGSSIGTDFEFGATNPAWTRD